jgi:hypothetical protein
MSVRHLNPFFKAPIIQIFEFQPVHWNLVIIKSNINKV